MNKRRHKYPFRDPFTHQHDQIQRRKFELFKRDPAAMRREGLLKHGDVPPEVEDLLSSNKLDKKWNTTIWRSVGPSIGPFSTVMLGVIPRTIVDLRDEYIKENIPVKEFNRGLPFRTNRYRLYPIPEDRIPILINPCLLALQDAKKVKEHVWNIVEREILKRKENEKDNKVWSPLAPPGEPKEIAFLYRTDEETFRRYLKWYDLHMGKSPLTPKGLPFRTIAFLEYVEKNYPEKLEEVKKKIPERTKTIKSTRGERILKGVIGEPIRGEDAVEKGVKLIYKAIHRKPYPSKRTKPELYNCPDHRQPCPQNCSYLREWMRDFNKRNMLFKPLNTGLADSTTAALEGEPIEE